MSSSSSSSKPRVHRVSRWILKTFSHGYCDDCPDCVVDKVDGLDGNITHVPWDGSGLVDVKTFQTPDGTTVNTLRINGLSGVTSTQARKITSNRGVKKPTAPKPPRRASPPPPPVDASPRASAEATPVDRRVDLITTTWVEQKFADGKQVDKPVTTSGECVKTETQTWTNGVGEQPFQSAGWVRVDPGGNVSVIGNNTFVTFDRSAQLKAIKAAAKKDTTPIVSKTRVIRHVRSSTLDHRGQYLYEVRTSEWTETKHKSGNVLISEPSSSSSSVGEMPDWAHGLHAASSSS